MKNITQILDKSHPDRKSVMRQSILYGVTYESFEVKTKARKIQFPKVNNYLIRMPSKLRIDDANIRETTFEQLFEGYNL